MDECDILLLKQDIIVLFEVQFLFDLDWVDTADSRRVKSYHVMDFVVIHATQFYLAL